ncbi:MAG: bifunctional hydroxymethylpyrimidine kinase/phosphomethylpyrimidine kinase [Gammaproteobacteria bacterium]
MQGRVLIIAGSDSSGGAGIQADIRTIAALGGRAATAITALTAQNTKRVHAIVGIDPAFVARQAEAVLQDIGADCIKTGMLYSGEIIDAVCDLIEAQAPGLPWVVDPVMLATSGATLLDPPGIGRLVRRVFPHAAVLTPNVPEAERLTGMRITTDEHMIAAAKRLLGQGPKAILLKGAHRSGDTISDFLVTDGDLQIFQHPRIETPHLRGTGCTLGSAIATGLAQGMTIGPAVARATEYVLRAYRLSSEIGQGSGFG